MRVLCLCGLALACVGCSSGDSAEVQAEKAMNAKAGPVAAGLAPKQISGAHRMPAGKDKALGTTGQ